jgi:hypothetical protein
VSRRDDQRVADILDAASEIGEVIELGRDAWDKDRIRQLAVERLLEIIGEAANSLSEQFRAQHPAIPWRDLRGQFPRGSVDPSGEAASATSRRYGSGSSMATRTSSPSIVTV